MFQDHIKVKKDKEEILCLFISYDFEFAKLEENNNTKELNIFEQIKKYIKNKKIKFKGNKIFLIFNGIVISLLLLSNPYNNLNKVNDNHFQYVEYIDHFTAPAIANNAPKDITTNPIQEIMVKPEITNQSVIETPTPKSNINKSTTNKSTSETVSVRPSSTPTANITPPPVSSPTTQTPVEPVNIITSSTSQTQAQTEPIITKSTEQMVSVYRSNGTIQEMTLEEYIVGVVGAEMPAAFNPEALKAQSLLARTYALKKIQAGQILTDNESTQAFKDINQLKTLWGSAFDTYYNKIVNAVSSTKGQYITYNGKYIEAVYHSTSNGKTENAVDIWGNAYPYLVSVDSHWDLSAPSYSKTKDMDIAVVSSLIGIDINLDTTTQVIERTEGDNIKTFQINNNTYDGVYLRNLLGLRSTDFDMSIKDNIVTFTTRGYGHGVGMSQYGANGMAKEGYTYQEIINHYYPGVIVRS